MLTRTNTGRTGRPPGKQGADLLATARKAFLEHGFDATTVNDIAARAGISKSSLYRDYESKHALFEAVVTDWTTRGRDSVRPHLEALAHTSDLDHALRDFATVLRAAILSPEVTAMRRLVAAESRRFPDVAALYLETSWQANIAALAATLSIMADRGLIDTDDPHTAAEQLVWLTVGPAMNATTITGQRQHDDTDAQQQLEAAVHTFLARYRT